jgi:ribosome-binding protein aMBF1 (putative translation factor)
MDEQDWTTVTIKKRKSGNTTNNGSKTTLPQQHHAGTAAIRKVEATEFGKPRQLSTESRNEIVQRRIAMGKNQIQLNQECRFPVNTIRDIENGRICPSVQQLNLLNRVFRSSIKFEP